MYWSLESERKPSLEGDIFCCNAGPRPTGRAVNLDEVGEQKTIFKGTSFAYNS